MQIVNLTPHTLVLIAADGRTVEIPPSGQVARVQETIETVGEIVVDGVSVPLVVRRFGQIDGLPEPQEGVLYAVSAITAEAAWAAGRTDVVVTGDYVRNENGRIVGARVVIVHPQLAGA